MRGQALAVRFWSKVDKGRSCWLWKGAKRSNGYGSFRVAGKLKQAHRVAYELTFGSIVPGLFVCHSCDVPGCVNPKHLFTGTPSENMKDMVKKGRRYMPVGEQHQAAKLSAANVIAARAAYATLNISIKELANTFGVTDWAMSCVLKNKTWKHV